MHFFRIFRLELLSSDTIKEISSTSGQLSCQLIVLNTIHHEGIHRYNPHMVMLQQVRTRYQHIFPSSGAWIHTLDPVRQYLRCCCVYNFLSAVVAFDAADFLSTEPLAAVESAAKLMTASCASMFANTA